MKRTLSLLLALVLALGLLTSCGDSGNKAPDTGNKPSGTGNMSHDKGSKPSDIGCTTISNNGGMYAVIDQKGGLWTWGRDSNGRLGDGTVECDTTEPAKVLDRVASICVGNRCTAALDMDGVLWMWGLNNLEDDKPSAFPSNSVTPAPSVPNSITVVPTKILDGVRAMDASDNSVAIIKEDNSL